MMVESDHDNRFIVFNGALPAPLCPRPPFVDRKQIELVFARQHFANLATQVRQICRDRMVRFTLPLPSEADKEFHQTERRKTRRSADAALKAWEQACRQRWRALLLAIKAKLEAVAAGISEFEDEFLA